MIKQFRENIRAVDYEIIQELNTLFMRSLLKYLERKIFIMVQKLCILPTLR